MNLSEIRERGLVLLGCGKMGTALLEGWLSQGLQPACFTILDPAPSDRLTDLATQGLNLNSALPASPAIAVLAVKPQTMGTALEALKPLGNSSTVFLSIAAGTPIAAFETAFGAGSPVVRAMPNTPAAVGRGISALIANTHVSPAQYDLAEALMGAVGQTLRLNSEDQMDAVTAVSGSGPAYVFYMIDAMARAGTGAGLPPELALKLAQATVAGAGALAEASADGPEQLRINVTSPGGTTAAALAVLMRPENGLMSLMQEAVFRAAERSRELAGSA